METIMTYKAKDYPHNIWFTVSLCLPRGEYKLVFIGTLGLAPLNSLAIDSISLLSTTCQSPMTNKSGNLFLLTFSFSVRRARQNNYFILKSKLLTGKKTHLSIVIS